MGVMPDLSTAPVVGGSSAPAPGRRGADAQAPLLAAESVTRWYGDRKVVDVDRLEVRAGEVVAVLGPNGAGKSTLFRLLLLLERPDTGRILLNGHPISPGDDAARRRLAGVFQRPHLFTGTVADNIRFGLRATRVPRAEWADRVERALDGLGLEALRSAGVASLSGGEAQRAALARALALEPEVLLLDEPTASLDVTIRRQFREALGRVIRQRARAAVLITHDAADAFDLADRVAVMEDGRIVQVGTPADLTTAPATPFVAAFTGAELLLEGVVDAVGDGTVTVRAGEALLVAMSPEQGRLVAGDRVHVRYRPEDVVLAPRDAPDVSARNRIRMRVRETTPAGGLIRVRLDGPFTLAALLTRESADRLGVAPGAEVTALLKTTALHVYPHA